MSAKRLKGETVHFYETGTRVDNDKPVIVGPFPATIVRISEDYIADINVYMPVEGTERINDVPVVPNSENGTGFDIFCVPIKDTTFTNPKTLCRFGKIARTIDGESDELKSNSNLKWETVWRVTIAEENSGLIKIDDEMINVKKGDVILIARLEHV